MIEAIALIVVTLVLCFAWVGVQVTFSKESKELRRHSKARNAWAQMIGGK